MINNIEEYLSLLKAELADCDPDTIHNALADSEEHLRTALESDPDLQSVIEKYGSPEELASSYRDLEDRDVPLGSHPLAHPIIDRLLVPFGWMATKIILLFIAFGLILIGGFLIWASEYYVDGKGYEMSDFIHIESDAHAILLEHDEIALGDWPLDTGRLVRFKSVVANSSVDSSESKRSFVGVTDFVSAHMYLDNVAYDEITNFKIFGTTCNYESFSGNGQPSLPDKQSFWKQSRSVYRSKTLEWDTDEGEMIFVIMNEDGSAGIDVTLFVGAKVPWLLELGSGWVFGIGAQALIVGLMIGATVILFFVRKRRSARVKIA